MSRLAAAAPNSLTRNDLYVKLHILYESVKSRRMIFPDQR
jgi:hypothetical protein